MATICELKDFPVEVLRLNFKKSKKIFKDNNHLKWAQQQQGALLRISKVFVNYFLFVGDVVVVVV